MTSLGELGHSTRGEGKVGRRGERTEAGERREEKKEQGGVHGHECAEGGQQEERTGKVWKGGLGVNEGNGT